MQGKIVYPYGKLLKIFKIMSTTPPSQILLFYPLNNNVDFVWKREAFFFWPMFQEAKGFLKPTKWESSSFIYYATATEWEEDFSTSNDGWGFLSQERFQIEQWITKEKNFHRVFQMHFGRTTCMRLLKANLVTFDNMTHSPPLWKVIWVIWFKSAESIRSRTITISPKPKFQKSYIKKQKSHNFVRDPLKMVEIDEFVDENPNFICGWNWKSFF